MTKPYPPQTKHIPIKVLSELKFLDVETYRKLCEQFISVDDGIEWVDVNGVSTPYLIEVVNVD